MMQTTQTRDPASPASGGSRRRVHPPTAPAGRGASETATKDKPRRDAQNRRGVQTLAGFTLSDAASHLPAAVAALARRRAPDHHPGGAPCGHGIDDDANARRKLQHQRRVVVLTGSENRATMAAGSPLRRE